MASMIHLPPAGGRSQVKSGLGEQARGGQGGNRTPDASLFRAALYQLSYLAIETVL